MYDPRFEKDVQRKMEELELRPSEPVWVNIEKAVTAERHRRITPFFLRVVAGMLIVAGSAAGYYFGEKAGRKSVAPVQAKVEMPGGTFASASKPSASTEASTNRPVISNSQAEATKTKVGATKTIAAKTAATNHKAATDGKAGEQPSVNGVEGLTASKKSETQQSPTSNSRFGAYLYTPGLEGQRFAAGIQGAELKSNKNLVSLRTLSRPRRPWEAGFIAGGGIDRLNGPEGGQTGGTASNAPTSFYGLARASAGAGAKNYLSDVQPGASFYAGIYLQKPVSDRWIFHTGLDLHYYSTSVSIGQQVSVIASPSASLLNQRTLSSAPAPLVFALGDQQTYMNRYYLLELPVSMQYRLNRSKLLPLFVEGGGSVSRLMGANAIFYNPSTGLYQKNENVLNKTQVNISSALLVGLPLHGIRIQTGPEIQYGLTPLINGQSLGDQHFFYAGLRLVVLPGRR